MYVIQPVASVMITEKRPNKSQVTGALTRWSRSSTQFRIPSWPRSIRQA